LFTVGYLGYPLRHQSEDVALSIGQGHTLQQNWSLRAENTRRDNQTVKGL